MRSLEALKAVIDRCTYPGFVWIVTTDGDGEPWFQIRCPEGEDTATGAPMDWKGRKWKLSYHMTDTEIVQTVWAAVERALIHEACELFKFEDEAIFDRHIDVRKLVALRQRPDALDGRETP